jgi:hypothetical protein
MFNGPTYCTTTMARSISPWRRPCKPDQLMIDATHLKAHRTAASLLKKGMFPDVSDAPKAA